MHNEVGTCAEILPKEAPKALIGPPYKRTVSG